MMARYWIALLVVVSLAGCFWESRAPDLVTDDKPRELIVVWDRADGAQGLIRDAWSTADPQALLDIAQRLDTQHWQSASTLPAPHRTHIVLRMHSGKEWEIIQGDHARPRIQMFDRQDPGWSGWLPWQAAFFDAIAAHMKQDLGYLPDLRSDYRQRIMQPTTTLTITPAAQAQLARFPGHPEMRWDKARQAWQYTGAKG